MLWNTERRRIALSYGTAECILFGTGSRPLVLLPGLGDSLREGGNPALPVAFLYRHLGKTHRVAVISRAQPQKPGATTRDMAAELAEIMEKLGFARADVVGVSMGGMIAQHLAVDFPQLVGKLVLVVTCGRPNPVLEGALDVWCGLAQQGDYRGFLKENLRLIYTAGYCRKNGWMVPLVSALTKPRSFAPFFNAAHACRTHNAWEQLPRIAAPTLVLGGEADRCLGGEASRELAARILGARLRMYPGQGHGLYEEAPDFQQTVLAFLTE